MRCKICGEDRTVICLCGYCQDCISRYGHEKCSEMLKEENKCKEKE